MTRRRLFVLGVVGLVMWGLILALVLILIATI